MEERASADYRYAVYREEGGIRYPNGQFATPEDAEEAKKRVKAYHGSNTRVVIVDLEAEPEKKPGKKIQKEVPAGVE